MIPVIEYLRSICPNQECFKHDEKNHLISFEDSDKMIFRFQYAAGEVPDVFDNFISVYSEKNYQPEDRPPLSPQQSDLIINSFKQHDDRKIGELYRRDDDTAFFVLKSTLYCEEADYLNMLKEIINIHKEIQNNLSGLLNF